MSESEEKSISPPLDKKEEEENDADESEDKEKPMEEDDEEESAIDDSKDTDDAEKETTPVKTKSPKKAKQETVNDEDDEDEDEEDEEPKLGLLERPVVIESGKREKKKVERLSMTEVPHKETMEIAKGSGDRLGDCQRIEHQIQKNKAEDLKTIHRLLYNRVGKATEVKKNLRQFSGFAFDKSDNEYNKKLTFLTKLTVAVLKGMCEVFDLEKGGKRNDIAERILEFCMCPKDSGRPVPGSKKRKRSVGKKQKEDKKGKQKKKKEKPKKEKPAAKKKSAAKAEDSESEEEEDEEEKDEEDESEEEEESEAEEESEEEEAPKKKKKKIESPKEKAKKKPEPKKETPVKKEKKPVKKKKVEVSSDESSDDEQLIVKKKPEPPTNADLKALIKKILEKANLEEITMKTVVKQVYAKYPDFDITDRKDFIKETVRQMIS